MKDRCSLKLTLIVDEVAWSVWITELLLQLWCACDCGVRGGLTQTWRFRRSTQTRCHPCHDQHWRQASPRCHVGGSKWNQPSRFRRRRPWLLDAWNWSRIRYGLSLYLSCGPWKIKEMERGKLVEAISWWLCRRRKWIRPSLGWAPVYDHSYGVFSF